MLDFGFSELFLILVLAIFLTGPEDIPKFMRFLGRLIRRLQYVRFAFSKQFEDFMKNHEIEELRWEARLKNANEDKKEDMPPS